MKALNHPVRVKALAVMAERTASPSEIARLLDSELSIVSYHVRVLEEFGLIELVEEEPVRGSVAHFYRAVDPASVASPEWEELDQFGHLQRATLRLDAQGWERVAEIQQRARDQILDEQAKARDRLAGKDKKAIQAMVVTLLFRMLSLPSEE